MTYVNAISVAEELGLKVTVNMSEKTEAGSGYVSRAPVEWLVFEIINL